MRTLTKAGAATAFVNWLEENWEVTPGDAVEFRLRLEHKAPDGVVWELTANGRTAGEVS